MNQQKYISRITKDGRAQLTSEHLLECAEYAAFIGKKFSASNLCRTAALFHDIGKFSTEFVEYLYRSHEAEMRGEKAIGMGTVIHSTQGAKYVYEANANLLIKELISICIACHHGGLMDGISPEGETPLRDRLIKENENLNYTEIFEAAGKTLQKYNIDSLLKECDNEIKSFVECCNNSKLDKPFMLHLLAKSIFSCLVDSDRYNAYCFEVNKPMNYAAIPNWGNYAQRLENKLASFSGDSEINIIRSKISNACLEESKRPKGIYRLDVPTGGGKTLASLRFALNHAKEHKMEHVIYVIPYLSVIEQTAKNIREALNTQDESFILEHHSNVIISDDSEEAHTYKLLTDRWDSPIILTTMVQFLESIYSHKSSDLRKFHNMANTVFIFDEVQALPPKCIYLFNQAINYLHYCAGSTILLCTATQPPLDNKQVIEKPILLSEYPSLIPDMSNDFAKLKRTRIKKCIKPGGYTLEELRDFVLSKYNKESNCLVILNTKKTAEALYRSINSYLENNPHENIKLVHLSTNMCPAHRLDTINDMKKNNLKNTICISTQLIEAGVDISFNCVIRVIAGLDSIAQAAGRCNRNGEDPNGKNVYIVNLENENIGMLPEIKTGADITYAILSSNSEYDILSSNVIQNYYNRYFNVHRTKMSYPIGEGAVNLYDLLSCNIKGRGAIQNRGRNDCPALVQAFQTAGEVFSVIDNRTTSVIVPYKDSKKLVGEYTKATDIDTKRKLLRQLGRYSVSLYSHKFNEFQRLGVIYPITNEMYMLNSKFYDDDKLGVIDDIYNIDLIVNDKKS